MLLEDAGLSNLNIDILGQIISNPICKCWCLNVC